MAYTYLLYHIIIRPKESKPVIKTDHEKKLSSYIWGICKEKKCVLHRINGMKPEDIRSIRLICVQKY